MSTLDHTKQPIPLAAYEQLKKEKDALDKEFKELQDKYSLQLKQTERLNQSISSLNEKLKLKIMV